MHFNTNPSERNLKGWTNVTCISIFSVEVGFQILMQSFRDELARYEMGITHSLAGEPSERDSIEGMKMENLTHVCQPYVNPNKSARSVHQPKYINVCAGRLTLVR